MNISKVYVCPQGIAATYAGVRTEEMERRNTTFDSPMELLSKEAISVLVDIGGGTVDPVVLKYGLPQPMEDENPAKGIIWTYSNIRRDIKAKTGQDISEEAVNMVLNGEPVRMDNASLEIIRDHMDSYANRLLMELREKGLPFSTAYTIVQGGGAGFVRNQWKRLDTLRTTTTPSSSAPSRVCPSPSVSTAWTIVSSPSCTGTRVGCPSFTTALSATPAPGTSISTM